MEFSAPYDRDLRDVLILQSEVAEAVVRTIAVTLTPDAQARLARARRIHPEAYQDYLRGAVLVEPKDRGSPQAGARIFQKRWDILRLNPGETPSVSDAQYLDATLRVLDAWKKNGIDVG